APSRRERGRGGAGSWRRWRGRRWGAGGGGGGGGGGGLLLRLFRLDRLYEPFPVEAAQELRGAIVQVPLGGGEPDLGVPGPACRQVQVVDDARAPRADHHLVRQGAEGFGVAGLAVVARNEVCFAELLPGAELAGPEQGDQVVQLAEVVLQGRRREQQNEVPLDLL